jgi:hypothetical protein
MLEWWSGADQPAVNQTTDMRILSPLLNLAATPPRRRVCKLMTLPSRKNRKYGIRKNRRDHSTAAVALHLPT